MRYPPFLSIFKSTTYIDKKIDTKKLFVVKPLYQRALIVAGGPLANFLLAIVIFSCIYMFVGKDFTPAKIEEVVTESPAEKAGLKEQDVILKVDGKKVDNTSKLKLLISSKRPTKGEIKEASALAANKACAAEKHNVTFT